MGTFSLTHWLVVLVIILIVFGAGKLPEIGRALGRSTKEFKEVAGNEESDGVLAASVAPRTRPATLGAHTDQR